MPSLRIVQTLGTIETPNGRIIVDQPSVKTVKATVTSARRSSVGRFGTCIFLCCVPKAVAGLTSQLLQDFPHVYPAEEFGLFAHQLQQYLFAFRTDRSQAPQIDNQFAPFKICFGFSYALVSSAAQGAMSLPSTSSRRWRRPSITVIFSMPHLSLGMRTQRMHQRDLALTTMFSM